MKENKYTHQVEQRREAEQLTPYEQELIKKVEKDRDYKQSLYIPIKPNSVDLSIEDLIAHLQENGIGDAKLYNRLYRGEIVYVKYWERFLVWNGHHWREDDWNEAYQAIESVCEKYLAAAQMKEIEADGISKEENPDLKKKVQSLADKGFRRVDRLRSKNGQDDLLTMTRRTHNPLLILPSYIDVQYYLLPCPNGVVDLRTGDLHDGRPEDYLLNACLTEYDPELLKLEDPCPETNAFLLRSMNGNQRLVDFIWRILGYGLIRDRKDHVFIIFWGEHGRNGKDTLIKLVTHVLGLALSGDVQVEMFLQQQQSKSSSSPTPDVLALRGMSIAWINEAEDGQKFALAKLKKLTGGGFITARGLMDKQQTTWLQTHLPIMTTNELPKAKAEDAAFWQRAHIVKWELSFVDDPKEPFERQADKYLDTKIQAEAKGVLARMVQGAKEYLSYGLNVPEEVKKWTQEQRDSFDDLGQFIEECCLTEEHQDNNAAYSLKVPGNDLHEAFCIWYAANKDSRYSISAKAFAIMLNKKNIAMTRSNGTWRLGISLKPAWKDRVEEKRREEKAKKEKNLSKTVCDKKR
ncbi:DNA primase family protein [Bilophila wadsworthia]